MTCRECQDQMLEVARRRAAPFVEKAVRAHADACEPCRTALEQGQTVSAALRSLAVADAAQGASHGMEGRLLSAFAEARPEMKTVPDGRTVRWMPIAAGIALCAGIAGWWLARPVSPGDAAPTPSAVTASVPGPAAVAATRETANAVPPAPERRAPARPHKAPPRAPVGPTGFVPIPAAAGLPDFESGEIVRVGIPITSLPNYGVEIPPDATTAAIQADFLVGQDGRPRAIRLVTNTVEGPRPRR
jgi:hypothetical protein